MKAKGETNMSVKNLKSNIIEISDPKAGKEIMIGLVSSKGHFADVKASPADSISEDEVKKWKKLFR